MNDFEKNFLREYFNELTDSQKIDLLIEFFEELQIQEVVDCPCEEHIKEDPESAPYWAHTGEPLI